MDISTHFMGLSLPNPVIVSSSSFTATTKAVQLAVNAGAGAVVLKSLFEEDIAAAASESESQFDGEHPEAAMYREQMQMLLEPDSYLTMVEECAASLDVPVIASLNCHTNRWWIDYAARIAAMGADAIELNISPISLETKYDSRSIENTIIGLVRQARQTISIPLAVKIGPYFSALPHLVSQLKDAGANSLTLFNRFYRVDINTDKISLKSGNSLSNSEELGNVLRWIGILSDISDLDISASTGIYDAQAVVKVLLAGAKTAQICSVLYRNGLNTIKEIIRGLQYWMEEHAFDSLDKFRGLLSLSGDKRNIFYERLQYVKALKGE